MDHFVLKNKKSYLKKINNLPVSEGGKEEDGAWKNELGSSPEEAAIAAPKCRGYKMVCNKHTPLRTREKSDVMRVYNLGISVTFSSAYGRGYKDKIKRVQIPPVLLCKYIPYISGPQPFLPRADLMSGNIFKERPIRCDG